MNKAIAIKQDWQYGSWIQSCVNIRSFATSLAGKRTALTIVAVWGEVHGKMYLSKQKSNFDLLAHVLF